MAQPPRFHDDAWEPACGGGACVEVAFQDGWVGVRDGKAGGEGPVLAFTLDEWGAFVDAMKQGRFDTR